MRNPARSIPEKAIARMTVRPPSFMMPFLRSAKLATLRRRANSAARGPSPADDAPARACGFVVGAGRSGTTILGEILSAHPGIHYLFEPYHLWAAVEPRTDVTNLHIRVDGRFMMTERDATEEVRRRFRRLVFAMGRDGQLLVEKTPHNVARIGFLEVLAPGSRYVHLVRNGVDVARSVDRIASANRYRMAGKPDYNQWWGEHGVKWAALARDGADAGYFPDEVDLLTTHAQRGAYEWIVSLGEADRWRDRLGERLVEITLAGLIGDAPRTLGRICELFGIDVPAAWLAHAQERLRPERRIGGAALALPPAIRERFNELQDRYGFEGRATAMG